MVYHTNSEFGALGRIHRRMRCKISMRVGVVMVCFSMFRMGIYYVSEHGLILEPGLTMVLHEIGLYLWHEWNYWDGLECLMWCVFLFESEEEICLFFIFLVCFSWLPSTWLSMLFSIATVTLHLCNEYDKTFNCEIEKLLEVDISKIYRFQKIYIAQH